MDKKTLYNQLNSRKYNSAASSYLVDMVEYFYNSQKEFKSAIDAADKKSNVQNFGTTSYVRYRTEINGVETEITVYYNRFLDLYDVITNSAKGQQVFRITANSYNLVEYIEKNIFQTSALKHLLATKIEDMELSVLTITMLQTKGINTLCDILKIRLDDIVESSDAETASKIYAEIRDMFNTFGIDYKL